ncbi:GTPase HflX [Acetomicrobium sp. S15 = DSM 107314]|uniref:GTPase HflX n=1 Tax=Acetomicrobium sp. S15 = DSM 107314 TaxID=2529858 RepID=UPI003158E04C
MKRPVEIQDKDSKRALLLILGSQEDREAELLAGELELLLKNLGITPVGRILQERRSPDPAYFLGRGKVEEAKVLAEAMDANLLVCDDPLTPSQMSNIGELTGLEVWDRHLVIMKIFEARARSAEAKLQVELARCRYEIPRLKGLGLQMSRPGGGIGTRGPGETEFERHRRKLMRRTHNIRATLENMRRQREDRRKRRKRVGLPTVSLVGYTNSGKSTLLKRLSGDKSILVADQLFSTLDTTVRKIVLPHGTSVLFSDTVGFIRKLPPDLIAAFQATLEELKNADILLVVLDGTDDRWAETLKVIDETLAAIGAAKIPRMIALNKVDALSRDETLKIVNRLVAEGERVIPISALRGDNIPSLLDAIEEEVSYLHERLFVKSS